MLREQLRCARDGLLDLGSQRTRDAEQPVLAAAAELKDERVERHGVFAQVLRRGVRDLLQLRALAPGIERREIVRLLVARNLRRDLHALVKQSEQLTVDAVDLLAIITKFHGQAPYSSSVFSAAGTVFSAERSVQKRG